MPLGTAIHNIEITLGKGGQLARAAGAVAKLIAKEGKSATLKLPSGECAGRWERWVSDWEQMVEGGDGVLCAGEGWRRRKTSLMMREEEATFRMKKRRVKAVRE
ncbi:ribosomal protein L2, carboxy-terminal domain protein [Medicago truncatula]|uniref:Ribosomal protein L2, carboxy-terminal domain protein n=1 Tax=Medicago truncatula TaxID=3880 RepID=A0A072UIT3_MEDTR|nr:ribosomal protein L2, carboxy-terminal domain protein [Medicago truncatula]